MKIDIEIIKEVLIGFLRADYIEMKSKNINQLIDALKEAQKTTIVTHDIITRTYYKGCDWCGASGVRYPMQNTGSGYTSICPVCNGNKIIQVIETIEK